MPTVQIPATADSVHLYSSELDYALAHAGEWEDVSFIQAGTAWSSTVGQNFAAGWYTIYRWFLAFDIASAVPAGAVITDIKLAVRVLFDFSTNDFDIQVRDFNWAENIEANWPANWDGAVGAPIDAVLCNTSAATAGNWLISPSLSLDWEPVDGVLRYALVSANDRVPPPPIVSERVNFNGATYDPVDRRPYLLVTYTADTTVPYQKAYEADHSVSPLPRWLATQSLDTTVRERSLLYKVLSSIPQASAFLTRALAAYGPVSLSDHAMTAPRLVWTCPMPEDGSAALTVRVKTAADDEYTTLRPAVSVFDFLSTGEPVYSAGDDGLIYMRNLARLTSAISSETGTFTFADPFIPDEDIWIELSGELERLRPGDGIIDYDAGTLTFPEAGLVSVRYASSARLAELDSDCIYINDLKPVTPASGSLWNVFDELASLAGVERLSGETNYGLRDRVRTAFAIETAPERDSIVAAAAHRLGLVERVWWDGESVLSLPADASCIRIRGIRERELIAAEKLLPSADRTVFASNHKAWDPGHIIYIDGMETTTATRPGMSVSEGRVAFASEEPGEVSATYTITNYEISETPEAITLSKTGNTVPGRYMVLYARNVAVYLAGDDTYMQSRLLDESGAPTQEYHVIAELMRKAVPITLGIAEWGGGARWFEDDEARPPLVTTPLLFR